LSNARDARLYAFADERTVLPEGARVEVDVVWRAMQRYEDCDNDTRTIVERMTFTSIDGGRQLLVKPLSVDAPTPYRFVIRFIPPMAPSSASVVLSLDLLADHEAPEGASA